jgi:hypothetical protein
LEAELDSIQPGSALAAALEGIDRGRLAGGELVALMRARSRLLAHVQAGLLADMAAVADAVSEGGGGSDPELEAGEVRAALLLTRRAAESQVGLAICLVKRFPRLWEALWAGELDLARVNAIAGALSNVRPEVGRAVIEGLLDEAGGLTSGQLRARLAKELISADPDGEALRRREGVKERRVSASPNPDGTANLMALEVSEERVAAAMARIHALARQTKTASDPRTADQLRADIFLDLLLGVAVPGADPSDLGLSGAGKGATVDLRVDVTTLAGLDQNPGVIPGWGPVLADVACRLVESQPKARWQVTVTGDEGEVVWNGTTRRRPESARRRRPDAAMRRQLTAVVGQCIFPGCRMPATQSDIDHNQPYSEGGLTDLANLGPACRHDHGLRQRGWKLERTGPWTWRWTSPLGIAYDVAARPP